MYFYYEIAVVHRKPSPDFFDILNGRRDLFIFEHLDLLPNAHFFLVPLLEEVGDLRDL